jgi:hypothetical protein
MDQFLKLNRDWSLGFEVERSEWTMRNYNGVVVWVDRLDAKRRDTVTAAMKLRAKKLRSEGVPVRECLRRAAMELHHALLMSKSETQA